MKFKRKGQPGIVDAVSVPDATQYDVASEFRSFIGEGAKPTYRGTQVDILDVDARTSVSCTCNVGDWLVRDQFGNVTVFADVFFHYAFKPLRN